VQREGVKLSSDLTSWLFYYAPLIHNIWDGIILDAIPKVVVRRFGAREIAPQGQEVENASTS
jgi:hypothetical protein